MDAAKREDESDLAYVGRAIFALAHAVESAGRDVANAGSDVSGSLDRIDMSLCRVEGTSIAEALNNIAKEI